MKECDKLKGENLELRNRIYESDKTIRFLESELNKEKKRRKSISVLQKESQNLPLQQTQVKVVSNYQKRLSQFSQDTDQNVS